MSIKIGRNDSCPCGSGKKYKKCCEQNKVVSIDRIVEQEVMELQTDILRYAFHHYEEELKELTEEMFEEFNIPDELIEVFTFHCTVWSIAVLPIGDQTILEEYIKEQAAAIKRPKVRALLQSWTTVSPSVLRVLKDEGDRLFLMKHLFTGNEQYIKMLESDRLLEEESLVFGVLVPMEDHAAMFTTFIDIPKEAADRIASYLLRLFKDSELPAPEVWLREDYLEVLYEALVGSSIDVMMANIEWENERYEEVIELVKSELQAEPFSEEFAQTATMLWLHYCEKRKPMIRNPRLYAAGLHYLLYTLTNSFGKSPVSQNELGKRYGVSASSVSSKFREIEDVLADEIDELEQALWEEESIEEMHSPPFPVDRMRMEREIRTIEQEIEGMNFSSIEEVNEYLHNRTNEPSKVTAAKSKRDQAQDLLYEAYESAGKRQVELAKKALAIYPHSPDAYILLGEHAKTAAEEKNYYEQAVEAGEKDLGKAYIKENKGSFWKRIETRPYMRAKLIAAQLLWENGEFAKAIKEYNELIELNPDDNQGVRYLLLPSYLELEMINEAEALLQQYEDDYSTNFLYNKLLVSYMKHGITPQLSELLAEAQKQNAHVLPYIMKQKNIPAASFDYIGFGDETEAIAYAQEHAPLWWDNQELVDYIKKII